MRREGLEAQTLRSLPHHTARALGRSLGSNADRLPAWLRRSISLDGRESFEPDERPVLFVTNHAPPFRVGAFAALHEREDVVFALIGGGVRHGGGGRRRAAVPGDPAAPARGAAARRVRPLPGGLAGLSGRVALPAAYARRAARRACRSSCGRRSGRIRAPPPTRCPTCRCATSTATPTPIATYGPHVSAYVRAKGAGGPVVEAPQSVDVAFWSAPAQPDRRAPFQVMFAGRLAREKGLSVLLRAWRASGLSAPSAALVLVGDGPIRARAAATGAAMPVRTGRPGSAAQLLRGLRRRGHAVDPHARLPASRGGWWPTKPSTREFP